MKQMRNADAPAIAEVRYDWIICALFRRKNGPEIFLGTKRGGDGPTFCFRVNKDGTVPRKTDIVVLSPVETVEVVTSESLGMGPTIRWEE